MIELRWLETVGWMEFETTRTLQYREHSHDVFRRGGEIETVWKDWKDVPIVVAVQESGK